MYIYIYYVDYVDYTFDLIFYDSCFRLELDIYHGYQTRPTGMHIHVPLSQLGMFCAAQLFPTASDRIWSSNQLVERK